MRLSLPVLGMGKLARASRAVKRRRRFFTTCQLRERVFLTIERHGAETKSSKSFARLRLSCGHRRCLWCRRSRGCSFPSLPPTPPHSFTRVYALSLPRPGIRGRVARQLLQQRGTCRADAVGRRVFAG